MNPNSLVLYFPPPFVKMRGFDGPLSCHDAHLFECDQSLDSETQSQNDMLIDPDEFVIGPPESEKDDLAVINPDELSNDDVDQMPGLPLADDCSFFAIILPYEVEKADVVGR
jgi:hypothetical protein